jgi:hypothetical protein
MRRDGAVFDAEGGVLRRLAVLTRQTLSDAILIDEGEIFR